MQNIVGHSVQKDGKNIWIEEQAYWTVYFLGDPIKEQIPFPLFLLLLFFLFVCFFGIFLQALQKEQSWTIANMLIWTV